LKHARLDAVAKHGNLADPEYEPTDDELRELAHSAFADVAARNEQALRRVREEIATIHAEVMKTLSSTHPAEAQK
jgi:hypothetical protein